MRSPILLWIVVLISFSAAMIALLRLEALINRFNNLACTNEKAACLDSCETRFAIDTLPIAIERSQATIEHSQNMTQCQVNNIGNIPAREECQRLEQERFSQVLAGINARIEAVRNNYIQCTSACDESEQQCLNGEAEAPIQDYERPFTIECIEEGGFICFKEVDDICTMISPPCDDCWATLCNGMELKFREENELQIALMAATSMSEKGRELAVSNKKGNLHTLNPPRGISLSKDEKLYLRFSGKGAIKGAKVLLVTDKKG